MNTRMCADPPIPRARPRIGSPEPGRRSARPLESRSRRERVAAIRRRPVEERDAYQRECGEEQNTDAERLHSSTSVGFEPSRSYNIRNASPTIADRRHRASE
jgi:hypothetical protein